MPNYPTKEEILAREMLFKPEILRAVKGWKREHYNGSWAAKTVEQKLASLCELVDVLDQGQRSVRVSVGVAYRYFQDSHTIEINRNNPSIISTIHEMGHHIHGHSELKAQRYAVWMFKKAFPRAYEQLEWHGHMLVRPGTILSPIELSF